MHPETPTTLVARFRNRQDAHRAVIELREVEFPAESIGAAFREGAAANPKAPAILDQEATPPPADSPAKPTAPLLPPETPITTLSGGSPFGEASTYQPPPPAEEDWWEGMRVALPQPASKAAPNEAGSQSHRRREVAQPQDTNFEPADRPAPAYDNDYQAGDYSYETLVFDPDSLAATLKAAGLAPEQASNIAKSINPGEALVTVTTTNRADEARSILTRNNGAVPEASSNGAVLAPIATSAEGTGRLHLYGEVLRCHTQKAKSGD